MKGVIGVYSRRNVTRKALYLLYGVQHRGQESAGISTAGDNSLRTWKDKGLITNVFDEKFSSFIHPDDYVNIGCTSGESTNFVEIPPIESQSEKFDITVALDGFIPELNVKPYDLGLCNTIIEKLDQTGNLEDVFKGIMTEMPSAYFSLVMILHHKDTSKSELVVVRDKRGIRPLYIAYNQEDLFVASESAPIDVLESMGEDIEARKDFTPGSIVVRDEKGLREKQLMEPEPAHCAFEWVYFGRPDSIVEGKNIHSVRKKLGQALVDTHYNENKNELKEVVIIPVPDSGRSVCIGVAEASGIIADEGVIKNAYLGRTYIIDDPEYRRIASDLKHNIIKETVENKKVLITDDSIVRGTVSESIANNLLKAGADEVEYLVSYAPILYPCFSDPKNKKLAASRYKRKSLEEIGSRVASNLPSIEKVRYNSPQNVIKAIGLPKNKICLYCINGENPFV